IVIGWSRWPLEALAKPVSLYSVVVQDAEADHTGGERRPGIDNYTQAVVPHPQPPQALQPTVRPLHHPADLTHPTAVGRPPLGHLRLNPQPPQPFPRPLAVEPPIGVRLVGPLLGPPRLATDLCELSRRWPAD